MADKLPFYTQAEKAVSQSHGRGLRGHHPVCSPPLLAAAGRKGLRLQLREHEVLVKVSESWSRDGGADNFSLSLVSDRNKEHGIEHLKLNM